MIHYSIDDFLKKIQKNKRLLSIDYGQRKTGLASTNIDLSLSSPYKTIITKSRNQLLIDLKKAIAELNPWGIILGYPLLKDGNESNMCEKIKIFAEQILENITTIDILLYNESGTSKKAQEILMNMEFKRKRRDKLDDQLAACILLDNFLEQKKTHDVQIL
jgi:putative holliday junction resolvase